MMINFKQLSNQLYSFLEPLFKEPKKHLKTWLVILGVLVTSWAIVFFLREPKVAEAGWWDETWLYRKAVQISNNSGQNLTDFQVAITVDTASLITAGKMQSDCDDLRITDINGKILPHWIEENNPGCNNVATKIWTKVPTVYNGTNATTVYVYYGNAQAKNVENGDDVFEFFDDFKQDTASEYTAIQTNHSIAVNTTDNYMHDIYHSTGYNYFFQDTLDYFQDIVISFRIYQNGWGGIFLGDESSGYHIDFNKNRYSVRTYGGGSGSPIETNNLPAVDTWTNGSIIRSGSNWKILKEGVQVFDWTENTQWKESVKPGLVSSYYPGEYYRWDCLFARQYASSEPSAGVPGSEEQSPGPVAYWKFDEGTGTTAHDSSGQGNDGTLVNGPTWQTEENCISGKCHSFNASEYVDLGNPKSLQITGSQTISMWLKPANFSARRNPYAKAYGGEGTITQETNGALNYYYGTAGGNSSPYQGFNSSQSLTLNEWNHIAIVRDLENMKLRWYINGKETSETNASYAAATASSLTAYIGNGYTSRYAGLIDEVKIYPYARTEEQIKSDYVAGASSKGSGAVFGHKAETAQITPIASKLVAHWKFDEGYGETTHDSSGNNNHGTMGTGDSAPSWTNEGKVGKALSFDGVDDYLATSDDLRNPSTFGGSEGESTVTGWIYPEDNTNRNIFGKMAGWHYFALNSSQKFLGMVYNCTDSANYWPSSNGTIPSGQWTHFATILTGNGYQIYINGDLDKNVSDPKLCITDYGSYSNIGSNIGLGSIEKWQGKIDEVKIYNYALSEEEVKQDYNRGKAVVMGQSSGDTGSTAPAGSAAQEYCVPGSSDYCAPPVAEWNFEENTGTTARDTSGNGNDGTLTNMDNSDWVAGANNSGAALSFDGNNDYVIKTSADSLAITGNITLSTWIKTNSSSSGGIISKYDIHSYWVYRLYMNSNGTISFNRGWDGSWSTTVTSLNSINDNNWHYISAVFDSENMYLFIDGALNNSTAETRASKYTNTWHDLCIGTDRYDCITNVTGDNDYISGLIDEVRIYNYARTPAQIAWDYNRGKPVGWWKFDECQGTTAYNSSGNGNHGTISIGATAPQTTAGTCTDGSSASAWYNGRNGRWNSSLSFDGADDVVNIGDIGRTDIKSLSFWVKPTSTTENIIELSASDNVAISNGNIIVTGFGAETIYVDGVARSTIADTNWHQITVISDTSITANTLNIGKTGSTYFDGQIDDVHIYNYALTPLQIKTLYNNGAVRFGE